MFLDLSVYLFIGGSPTEQVWTEPIIGRSPALSPTHMGTYQYGDHPWPYPQSCSNLFILESGWLALDWKAFLYK